MRTIFHATKSIITILRYDSDSDYALDELGWLREGGQGHAAGTRPAAQEDGTRLQVLIILDHFKG